MGSAGLSLYNKRCDKPVWGRWHDCMVLSFYCPEGKIGITLLQGCRYALDQLSVKTDVDHPACLNHLN